MIKTLSFRKKVFLSQLLLFAVFLLILFPFISQTVDRIMLNTIEEGTQNLINLVKKAENEKAMVEVLQAQEFFAISRASLLNDQGELLYDSYLVKVLGEKFIPRFPTAHPEVLEALKKGKGYAEAYSKIFDKKLVYIAIAFDFHGKKYVMRTAFAYSSIQEIAHHVEIGFLIFCFVSLLFFTALTWFLFNRLSQPIQEIIQAIKPYQSGKEEGIPHIALRKADEKDDFSRLADTLNSLSERVREQIKNITEERNEKEAILESLGEGVLAVDAQMHVRYVNFIGSKMLGIPKRHLIHRPFSAILDSPVSPLLEKCQHLLHLSQEKGVVVTDSIALGDGRKRYLDLIAAPKTRGSGAIIVLQDKSSHYKVLEMGKDFVANASHELRTPITIIKGFAETLQDMPELSKEMIADITEKIVRNCERMDNLVKNLLTLADIENLPETRFTRFDLVLLLESCLHTLHAVHPDAIATIEKSNPEIWIAGDPDLLELALMNLLHNAVKYSHPPARIAIQLEERLDEVKIAIRDQGIGIPQGDMEHIFERFYTVNKAHSRRLGGAGLGLSIVKTIIEKHDGTISVQSTVSVGTTFTILLPVERPRSAAN